MPEKTGLPEKCFVNIGSVGQPRDGDNRASYVIVDGDVVMFRRVAYDYDATMAKIRRIPTLDDFLARRLKVGK
jgi:diadenosine tetraphosphatase ApaH/serine/threonine PP2A family protein phosphatase